jgi:hypothetical protein
MFFAKGYNLNKKGTPWYRYRQFPDSGRGRNMETGQVSQRWPEYKKSKGYNSTYII